MASTEPTAPVNGTYAHQTPSYDPAGANSFAAANANNATSYAASQQPESTQSNNNSTSTDIPKDEVGWYFVEQYYTTLSKSPERLYVSIAAS